MIPSRYHSRESYERLYEWILHLSGCEGYKPKPMSNHELLIQINVLLRACNCEPISHNEIKEILIAIDVENTNNHLKEVLGFQTNKTQ